MFARAETNIRLQDDKVQYVVKFAIIVIRHPASRELRMGRKLQSCEAVEAHERLNDYLDPSEIDRLLDAAKDGPNGIRDYMLVLLTYRHGLRSCEAVRLRRLV